MKREMEAYIVLLHLVSQGWATFTDIRYLLGWDVWKQSEAIRIMAHINKRLLALSEEWSAPIPRINAFVFDRHRKVTSYICKDVFQCEDGKQPSSQEVEEYAKAIASYQKWDEVVEVFRKEAFS